MIFVAIIRLKIALLLSLLKFKQKKLNRLLLTLILLATLSLSKVSNAQKLHVFDKQGLFPIEDVYIFSNSAVGFTDAQGNIELTQFDPNSVIKISHPYYKSKTLTFQELKERNFRLRLEEDPVRLNEVIIAANKREEKRSEVAAQIESITSKEVQFYNPQTAADLVGVNSGIFIQKSQMGGGSPMLRGFAANRVLLVVDGVRMNNAIFRSGNLQNVISLDANSIAKSEVIFGPSSVIYGSDALGGVLNFQTLPARLSTGKTLIQGNAMTRYATANKEKTGHFDFNLGGKKWGWVSSLSYSDYDDLQMGSHGKSEYLNKEYIVVTPEGDKVVENSHPEKQIHSGYNQLNWMNKVRYRPSENIDLEYSLHYSKSSDVPRYDRLIQKSNGKPKYAQWYYGPQKWVMHHLKAKVKAESSLFDVMNINAAYQNYTESRHDRKLNKTAIRERTEEVDAYSLNIDFDKKLSENSMLYYGVDLLHNDVGSKGHTRNINTQETEVYASRYPDGSKYTSAAIYGSYKNNFSKHLTFSAGARYNYTWSSGTFDNRFYDFPFSEFKNRNGALTGNVGLVYHPDEQWQFNVNASTGFRAPNIDDAAKVFDSEPGTVIVPNPDLEPEYAANFELGIIRNFGNNAKFELTGYYTRLFNAMVRGDFQLNGKSEMIYDDVLSQIKAFQNADYANIWGMNLGFTGNLFKHVLFKSNFSYQYGRDNNDQPMRHIAPFFGSSHIIATVKQVRFDLYALYNGEVSYSNMSEDERGKTHMYATDSNGNPYSPSWITLNLKSTFQVNKLIQLNAGIENITDVRYRPYSSGIVAAGRNFIISLRVRI
ncbi:TonB-dependent receptor [Prolixibacteraceae bacterium JC049]|nr:TonB-dependent receptor [Prolixibacteraceae bacterium JC049]